MFEESAVLEHMPGVCAGECRPDELLDPVHPWSSYAPDGLLAMLLDHQVCTEGGAEQVERIGAWEKVVAWGQAIQLRELASFTAREAATAQAEAAERATARAAGEPVAPEVAYADGQEQAGAQVALALRISPESADCRVAEALTLTRRHAAAVDALEAGAVTLTKVRIIAEQTEQLSDEQAAAVTERVLPKAGQQTPPLLRRAVRRAVARTDADALRRRQQAAVADRGVTLYELPDGMAMLSARLPAPEAVGAYAVLDHHARSAQGPHDDRTLDARRADALIDLICGPAGHLSPGTTTTRNQPGQDDHGDQCDHGDRGVGRGPAWRKQVQVQVRVTVPFSTLFGLDDQPGDLAGYGPITPEQARQLAAAGTWRRVLTDPPTGLPIDFGTTTYRPPPALRDAILTAHPLCQAPGCTRAAVGCDLDHHTPFHRSGTTTLRDTGPYCRRHHRLKQTPRWKITHHSDGSVTWITHRAHLHQHPTPGCRTPAGTTPRL
ncbi:MAG: DUF222 domain-containing protein [Pseudonocardiaceae bacterium]|nr:DUF222 domain-containing protein [Pseudonocardiaceae bacterium]